MAKKTKIIIKDEELIPTTIGVVDKRQVGLIYLIFVFIILVVFVYFMPEINQFVENFGKEEIIETEIEEDLTYVSGMSITGDNVTLSNIVLTDYTLAFDIINTSSTTVNLENDYMYLEIFDIYDNLIGRINFNGIVLSSGETYSYTRELLYNDVNYFDFKMITESEYPEVTLNVDENEVENLVCSLKEEVITYEFSNNLLVKITNKTYFDETLVNDYVSLYTEYSSVNGVTAEIESEFEYYFSYFIDLTEFDGDITSNETIYDYKTDADIISFEMISNGYDCN